MVEDGKGGIEYDPRFREQLERMVAGPRNRGGLWKPYKDWRKVLCIAYGEPVTDEVWRPGKTRATEAWGRVMLERRLRYTRDILDEDLPWWRDMGRPRQAVLLNMAYDMGKEGLRTFVPLLMAMEKGEWEEARALMMNSLWCTLVAERGVELAHQLETGKWQNVRRRGMEQYRDMDDDAVLCVPQGTGVAGS